jgi:protein TonB
MFDSVLQTQNLPKGRLGIGLAVTMGIHIGVVLLAIWTSARKHRPVVSEGPVVKFVKPMAFAPPPPPPSRHQRTKVTPTKPTPAVQQAQIIQPKELPQEKPPEPSAEAGDDEADEGGVEGGAPRGVQGGVLSGVLGDIGKRFEFDENQMAKPARVSGQPIPYTDQAIEHEVEGTIVVKCVLAVDGAVRDCRVLRGLPFMDRAAVEALQSWRYRPVFFHGQPVDVDYTFRIKLSLPR